jgi:hypothetical protein
MLQTDIPLTIAQTLPHKALNSPMKYQQSQNVRTFLGIFNRGASAIEVSVLDNVMNLIVKIDNSRCEIKMKRIEVTIE